MIFDTHAHYDDEAFDSDRDVILSQMKSGGIERIVNVGAGMQSSESSVALSREYDFIYAAVGVHPENAEGFSDHDLNRLREWLQEEKVVALGEIGLDYYYPLPEREWQIQVFRKQLDLAQELQMPVIIHSRDAAKDTMDILSEYKGKLKGGVVHCFSYSTEIAKEVIGLGFYLGIGGVCTFKNAKKTVDVLREISPEHILIETDCPYLAPTPHRGERNSSLFLPLVLDKIAEIKNLSRKEIEDITWANGNRMYEIKD